MRRSLSFWRNPATWIEVRFASSTEAIKSSIFAVGNSIGLFELVRNSAWRASRLLILCYHGVSQVDEHQAMQTLYVPPDLLRSRFAALKKGGYAVVSLREGLDRLEAGTLPPRAVALTFDDGLVDFYRVAYPMLCEFGFPATAYVATQYVQQQLPAFPAILSYILWATRGREVDGRGIVTDGLPLATRTEAERAMSVGRLTATARALGADSPRLRDEYAAQVARRSGVDYDSIKRQRLFYLMTQQELAELDPRLVDVQLHTHTHSQPPDRARFHREIADNRDVIAAAGVSRAALDHFCYPNGETRPELPTWLREEGIRSATTCVPGLAHRRADPLLLPRFVDTQNVSALKFEAWLCGAATLLPRRS
jgi:peptidoglycan/xylan/chitin deacetylase (PgdA/CDA1 family)